MKICLLGEYSIHPNEGKKSVIFYLVRELSKHHRDMTLNPRNSF